MLISNTKLCVYCFFLYKVLWAFWLIVAPVPWLGCKPCPIFPLQTQRLHVIFAARSTITFCPSQQRSIWLRLMTLVVDINYVSLVVQNPSSFCHLCRYGNGFILSVPPAFVRKKTLRRNKISLDRPSALPLKQLCKKNINVAWDVTFSVMPNYGCAFLLLSFFGILFFDEFSWLIPQIFPVLCQRVQET